MDKGCVRYDVLTKVFSIDTLQKGEEDFFRTHVEMDLNFARPGEEKQVRYSEQQLLDQMVSELGSGEPQLYFIHGPTGCGKSEFCRWVKLKIQNDPRVSQLTDVHHFFKSLLVVAGPLSFQFPTPSDIQGLIDVWKARTKYYGTFLSHAASFELVPAGRPNSNAELERIQRGLELPISNNLEKRISILVKAREEGLETFPKFNLVEQNDLRAIGIRIEETALENLNEKLVGFLGATSAKGKDPLDDVKALLNQGGGRRPFVIIDDISVLGTLFERIINYVGDIPALPESHILMGMPSNEYRRVGQILSTLRDRSHEVVVTEWPEDQAKFRELVTKHMVAANKKCSHEHPELHPLNDNFVDMMYEVLKEINKQHPNSLSPRFVLAKLKDIIVSWVTWGTSPAYMFCKLLEQYNFSDPAVLYPPPADEKLKKTMDAFVRTVWFYGNHTAGVVEVDRSLVEQDFNFDIDQMSDFLQGMLSATESTVTLAKSVTTTTTTTENEATAPAQTAKPWDEAQIRLAAGRWGREKNSNFPFSGRLRAGFDRVLRYVYGSRFKNRFREVALFETDLPGPIYWAGGTETSVPLKLGKIGDELTLSIIPSDWNEPLSKAGDVTLNLTMEEIVGLTLLGYEDNPAFLESFVSSHPEILHLSSAFRAKLITNFRKAPPDFEEWLVSAKVCTISLKTASPLPSTSTDIVAATKKLLGQDTGDSLLGNLQDLGIRAFCIKKSVLDYDRLESVSKRVMGKLVPTVHSVQGDSRYFVRLSTPLEDEDAESEGEQKLQDFSQEVYDYIIKGFLYQKEYRISTATKEIEDLRQRLRMASLVADNYSELTNVIEKSRVLVGEKSLGTYGGELGSIAGVVSRLGFPAREDIASFATEWEDEDLKVPGKDKVSDEDLFLFNSIMEKKKKFMGGHVNVNQFLEKLMQLEESAKIVREGSEGSEEELAGIDEVSIEVGKMIAKVEKTVSD